MSKLIFIMQQLNSRFIIIGAGISGLQAATNLAQLGQDFIILQAQDRIGGRIRTVTIQQALKQDHLECQYPWYQKVKHTAIQTGATWICHEHEQIQQLASKFKIDLHPQYYSGKKILALDASSKLQLEQYQHYYSQHKQKLMGLIEKMWKVRERFQKLLELKRLKALSQNELQQLRSIYDSYDQMSAYEFISHELQDDFLTRLVDNEIETLQAISSRHFSAMEFLIDDAGWHGIYFYLGVHQHNIDGYRATHGLTALLNAMKDNIQKLLDTQKMNKSIDDVLKLSHPVIQVRNHLSPVEVVTAEGQIFRCQKVLMAVPSGTLSKIKISSISQGKKLILDNMLDSHTIRMNMVFAAPFWRNLGYSGNVNFSHEFAMNQLVQLTPESQICGVVAFVFFRQGYARWLREVEQECGSLEGGLAHRYEITKRKAMKIIADVFLEGDTNSQHLKECVLFTRSLSQSPYIRNTYDSTTAPGTYRKLFELDEDHLDRYSCDQPNIVMLGSDFGQDEQHSGYMQGAIRIANAKITKEFVQACEQN